MLLANKRGGLHMWDKCFFKTTFCAHKQQNLSRKTCWLYTHKKELWTVNEACQGTLAHLYRALQQSFCSDYMCM
jgi:hypothetical protein